jgi:HK97 family phage prohead protease
MEEQRNFGCEIRNDNKKLEGHAAVFNERTDIGPFLEEILPGAFSTTIKEDDIVCLWNHNSDYVLARTGSGTLKLAEDWKGLQVIINPPDTQWGRDLVVSIERGDIHKMSFSFKAQDEEWIRGKKDLRRLKRIKLFDVSPVTFPAYEGTDIAIRSHEAWKRNLIPWNVSIEKMGIVVRPKPTIYTDVRFLIRNQF